MTTFTIYHGDNKPIKAAGKNQCHMLEFAEKYRGWHTYKKDRATLNALAGLKKRGCIETNNHGQFRFIYPRSEAQ